MAVIGIRELNRKLKVTIPKLADEAAERAIAKGAEELVDMMRRLVPRGKTGKLAKSIGWTFGEAPEGSFAIDTLSSRDARVKATIYAGSKEAFYVRFVEFGTAPHSIATNASVKRNLRQDQGTLHPGARAKPFFYPSYRALRRRIRSRVTREVKKAVRKGFSA